MDYGKDFKKFALGKGIGSSRINKYNKYIIDSNAYINPSIIEEREMNIAQLDVFSRLIMDRIIYLGTPIEANVGNIITAQLLYLDSSSNDDISIYCNTPGGTVTDGYSIIDCMDYIKSDVSTLNVGMSASMGAVILSNGTKGKRSALPHSRVMIHQPSGGYQGTSDDMEINLEQIMILKKELYTTLSINTGKSYDVIKKDSSRDFWMTADYAFKYGIIDEVVEKKI